MSEPDYVTVTDTENGEPVELPTNIEDGTLSLITLEHAFPGAHGLKFKNPATGASRALLLDETGTKFKPPSGGWNGKLFNIILKPVTSDETDTKKRKRTSEDNGEINESEDSCSENDGERKKLKRQNVSEDKAICSDLIVLGLPYKLTSAELKDYFNEFGNVVLCEIKTNSKGESRGFGFIQMSDYAEQIRVLSKPNHFIGGRKCQVRMPLSKNGDVREPNLILNPKLFVTRVPEKATVDSLNQFFTERAHAIDSKCSVLDVYIPKPFRGFAFITLSSPAVAKELILKGDIIFEGASLAISAAAPREGNPKPKPRINSYNNFSHSRSGPIYFNECSRVGPRNGPVNNNFDRYNYGVNDYAPLPERYFDNGPKQRNDWRDSSNHMPPLSRFYDNDRRGTFFLDDKNIRGNADDSVLGMSPEVVTAAFKAFLSAAQQTINNGTNPTNIGSRNINYGDDNSYDGPSLGDDNVGNSQWR